MSKPKPINQVIPAAMKPAGAILTPSDISNTPGLEVFLDFDDSSGGQIKEMRDAAVRFVADMHAGKPPRWLSLLGPSGTGKTMLAKAIIAWAGRFQEDRPDTRYNQATHRILKRVGMFRWSKCVERMLGGDYAWTLQAQIDWLVGIDDIGSEYSKLAPLSSSKLYHILEDRLGLWTVLTANLSAAEISQKIDPRIASRLFRDGSDVIELDPDTPDYAYQQHRARKGKR